MENEFVPYELALRLKSLGFNENCFAFYKDFIDKWILMMPTQLTQHEQNNLMSYIEDGLLIEAPTFSQAFTWIYDNYQNNEDILIAFLDMTAFNVLYDKYRRLECLKKLIEIIEQKID